MEFLDVLPIHQCKEFIVDCCDLINSEWPRSKAARLQSLYMSSDKFPTSLVLILNEEQVVGHVKLTEIRLGGPEVMVESMIIHKDHRGKGWGKVLMTAAEEYLESRGKRKVYLSTRGQQGFYKKLGYEVCQPIMYFGYCDITPKNDDKKENEPKKESKDIPSPNDRENQPKKEVNSNMPVPNEKENQQKKEHKDVPAPKIPPPPPLPKKIKGRSRFTKVAKTYMCKDIV